MKRRKSVFGIFRLQAGRKQLFLLLLLSTICFSLFAQSNILSLEAQAVGSYNLDAKTWHWYSHSLHDAMQKPSVGFDYLYRASSATRDYGYLSLQTRLVYDEADPSNFRLQIYNAFVNLKQPGFDLWLGHHKTALGLSSYLDNHALLVADNTMSGLNFDRDWGAGIVIDRQQPIVTVAVTTGSGMPLYLNDNYLLTGRIGLGEYTKENYSIGLSGGYGNTLRSMGYLIMHDKIAHDYKTVGVDLSQRYLSTFAHADVLYGKFHEQRAYSGLLRLGYYLLPEDRASVEIQAMAAELAGTKNQNYSVGATYHLNADFTVRGLFSNNQPDNINTVALQLYMLKGLVF